MINPLREDWCTIFPQFHTETRHEPGRRTIFGNGNTTSSFTSGGRMGGKPASMSLGPYGMTNVEFSSEVVSPFLPYTAYFLWQFGKITINIITQQTGTT